MSSTDASAPNESLVRGYSAATIILGSSIAWLCVAVDGTPPTSPPERLIPPMAALFWLTGVVWLIMLVVRNTAVIRRRLSVNYFLAFQSDLPHERIERPARTFNNLMQVPTLFYVICILMLITRHTDEAQLKLAWTFVALRALHALVYMALNLVPYRFALWVSSYITLCVIWFRFVAHVPFG
jgi:hypothetical protein